MTNTDAALLAAITTATDDLRAAQVTAIDVVTTGRVAQDLALLAAAGREIALGDAYPLALPRVTRMLARYGWL